MAFNPFDLDGIYDTATSGSPEYWLSLGINLILSTIIGGIILIIILTIFSKKFGDQISYGNAFLLVLIANFINFFGLIGFILPLLPSVPYLLYILPVLIWILLLKIFLSNMSFLHIIIVAIIAFALTILVVPSLVGMVSGYLNLP